jgi:hypothetical protein
MSWGTIPTPGWEAFLVPSDPIRWVCLALQSSPNIPRANPETEGFAISSRHSLGFQTFEALKTHSHSLKNLTLKSLHREAWEVIDTLDAPNLITLKLETASLTVQELVPRELEKLNAFMKRCPNVTYLELCFMNPCEFLGEFLAENKLKLQSLRLPMAWDVNPSFLEQLRAQKDLAALTLLGLEDEDVEGVFTDPRHRELIDALSECYNLRVLVFNEPVLAHEFIRIMEANPLLEEVTLEPYGMDDEYLWRCASLRYLTSLQITSETALPYSAFVTFMDLLDSDPQGRHDGFNLDVARQDIAFKLTRKQEDFLSAEFEKRFKGKVLIYYQDPVDMHESDFSD